MTGGVKEYLLTLQGYAVAGLVKALRYKPEGLGFNSEWFEFS